MKRSVDFPHYSMVPKRLNANLAFRAELLTRAGKNKQFREQVYEMCRQDGLFYLNVMAWTFDPRLADKGLPSRVPFITYGYQDRAFKDILECIWNGRDAAMPKSRDMGASWIGLSALEWLWHFMDQQEFGLVSRKEEYVDKRGDKKALIPKIDFLHENMPKWMLPTGRWLGDDDPNRKSLHLKNADNGSVISGESTTGDIFRGGRLTALFIDEFAAFDTDDGFRVLNSTRDVTRCRLFNSTPQGANNAFYEVVHNTNAKQIRMHWTEHPDKAQGLYKTGEDGKPVVLDGFRGMVKVARKGQKEDEWVMFPHEYPFILDNKLRSPWYDGEYARCASEKEVAQELDIDFTGSDFLFFDPEFIQELRKKYSRPPVMVGDINFTTENFSPRQFRENDNGKIKLWMDLEGKDLRPPEGQSYIIGADISAGTGASNSVASIAEAKTGRKVGVIRTPNMDPKEFARQCIAMAKYFNNAFLIWDASGPTGKVFTNVVIDSSYRFIYFRRNEKAIGRKISDQPGYFLNSAETREALLVEYRADLAEHRFINPSDEGLKECLQFVRRQGGSVEHSGAANSQDPSGARSAHGDEVIADALTSLALRQKVTVKAGTKPEIPVGSLAWRNEQRRKQKRVVAQDGLGEGW